LRGEAGKGKGGKIGEERGGEWGKGWWEREGVCVVWEEVCGPEC